MIKPKKNLTSAPPANQRNTPLQVRLQKPLERVIAHGHPWIFRQALEAFSAAPGQVVTVLDRRGKFLARGLAEAGPIGVRVFSLKDATFDADFLASRITEALLLRDALALPATNALRLIHGEGDRLPGLVCDRYANTAVLKMDGEAIFKWRDIVLGALRQPLAARGIDTLLLRTGRGEQKDVLVAWGSLPPMPMAIEEHGMTLLAHLVQGQKTGLFLDHRESRLAVRRLAQHRRVLNLYAYTGGFSVAAGLGGASEVVSVDVAKPALLLAEASWLQNGLPPEKHQAIAADVHEYLAASQGEKFSLVVSDPPSFAPNEESLPQALKAYRRLHEGALGLLENGGLLLAASCSSHVDRARFEETLREAAHAKRKTLQVLGQWGAGPDHPTLLGFPEGQYLKVVLARVLSA